MEGDKIYLAEKADLDNHIANGNHPYVVTTEGTGEAYTATVEGITELKVGALLVIIPHINSASISATLDVNGLGAKQIRQVTSYASAAAVQPKSAGFLGKGKPVLLMYNGTYWLQATARANMLDAYGKLAIENGGTGADNAADALANLGAVPIVDARSAEWDMDAVLTGGEHNALYNTNYLTLGTPYNLGKAPYQSALILSCAITFNNAIQFAFMPGCVYPMMRVLLNGTISEWSTGFLPLSGGTMIGNNIYLFNKYGRLYTDTTGAALEGRNGPDSTTNRRIFIYNKNSIDNVANAVKLFDKINGVDKGYNIFGEHNTSLLASTIKSLLQGGSISVIKSVQRGVITIPSGSTEGTSTLTTSVNTAKAIVLYGGSKGENATTSSYSISRDSSIVLTSDKTVTAIRKGSTGDVAIPFQVVEYY